MESMSNEQHLLDMGARHAWPDGARSDGRHITASEAVREHGSYRMCLPSHVVFDRSTNTTGGAADGIRPGSRKPAGDRSWRPGTGYGQGAAADPVHHLLEARGASDAGRRHAGHGPALPRVLGPEV